MQFNAAETVPGERRVFQMDFLITVTKLIRPFYLPFHRTSASLAQWTSRRRKSNCFSFFLFFFLHSKTNVPFDLNNISASSTRYFFASLIRDGKISKPILLLRGEEVRTRSFRRSFLEKLKGEPATINWGINSTCEASFRGYGSCSSQVCQFARVEKLSRNSVIEPRMYSNSIIIAKNEGNTEASTERGQRSLINQFHYQDYIILLVRFEMGVLPTRGGGKGV